MATYESPYDPGTAPADLEFVKYEKKGHEATRLSAWPVCRCAGSGPSR